MTAEDKIKKFIDDADQMDYDRGGELVPFFDKSGLTENILLELNQYYNQAIDEAIAICNKSIDHADLVDDRTSLNTLNDVISKLESLKKKP